MCRRSLPAEGRRVGGHVAGKNFPESNEDGGKNHPVGACGVPAIAPDWVNV